MQTYTHLNAGFCISGIFLYNNQAVQGSDAVLVIVAGIVGAGIPDLVMLPLFLFDKIIGRTPMSKQGAVVIFLKEVSHSIILWMLLLFFLKNVLHYREILTVFACSGLVHIAMDMLTHAGKEAGADQSFTFPFNYLGFKIRWPFESWDYRYGTGILWPLKPWEMEANIIFFITGSLSILHLL